MMGVIRPATGIAHANVDHLVSRCRAVRGRPTALERLAADEYRTFGNLALLTSMVAKSKRAFVSNRVFAHNLFPWPFKVFSNRGSKI